VEALQGIFVIAASNRPELIDPALLRPGRLDRKLLCSLPAHQDRVAIMLALARHLKIATELGQEKTLQEISASCEGYSGADLQALLYNAQLEAIHDAIAGEDLASGAHSDRMIQRATPTVLSTNDQRRLSAACNPSKPWLHAPEIWRSIGSSLASDQVAALQAEKEQPQVELRHLRRSLGTTRPSISEDDRIARERANQAFMSARDDESVGSSIERAATRQTHM